MKVRSQNENIASQVSVRLYLSANGSNQNVAAQDADRPEHDVVDLQRAVQVAQYGDRAEGAKQMADDEDARPPEIGGVHPQLGRNEPVDDPEQSLT